MAFDFDTGPQGSEGPWISWSARGTQDGAIPARSFFLRDKDKNKTKIDAFEKGVVLDIENMKTGWQYNTGAIGQAPDWKLGASPSSLPERPGDDWKKGFQMRCAISKDQAADWHQAGAAVWGAFADIVPALVQGSKDNPGKLPVVKITGVKELQFKSGSTAQPVLEVVKWTDRPEPLAEKAAAGGFDTGDDTSSDGDF